MSEQDADGSFFEVEPDSDLPYLTVLIRHPKGIYCEATVIDISETAIIFEIDDIMIKKGYFTEKHLDSRYFKENDLEFFIVPHFPMQEM